MYNNLFPTVAPLEILAALALAALMQGLMNSLITFKGARSVPFLWVVIDILLSPLIKRLDRPNRAAPDLFMRGFFFTVILVLLLYFAALEIEAFDKLFPFTQLLDIARLAMCFTATSWVLTCWRAYKALNKEEGGSFLNLSRTAQCDFSGSDDFRITRMALEYCPRLLTTGIVGPAFWYLVGGLPLAFVYAGIAALAWRSGRDGHTKGFGKPALYVVAVMNLVPYIITTILMIAASAVTPTSNTRKALAALGAGKDKASYHMGWLPVSVLAWELNVSLGGPKTDLDGYTYIRPWAGPEGASAKLEPGHIKRALYLSGISVLVFVLGLLLLYMVL